MLTSPQIEEGRTESPFRLEVYLEDCRRLTLSEIQRFFPKHGARGSRLYELMLDYPLRPAKALRPALCMSTCMALGGHLDAALPSAAAFELIHNAFLVHDDVEDGSLLRRHEPTLHQKYGVPIAVNVGDGMLALALEPLLDNVRALGLGAALRILKIFARMTRESVEGQMLELDWVRDRRWDLSDREYLQMVHRKTGWYSFIAPIQAGAVSAACQPQLQETLSRFGLLLGVAFQIQDDLLSLESTEHVIGKDSLGDLWEGKYTLPLLHTLRVLPSREKAEALEILRSERRSAEGSRENLSRAGRKALHSRLVKDVRLSESERAVLDEALLGGASTYKDEKAIRRLADLVTGRNGESLAYARNCAVRHARRAEGLLDRELSVLPGSVHKLFLRALVGFVTGRKW